ncbi:MAG: hypothetical protein UH734_07355, partial [Ruminococcus sp.]|nr:hypothetical protein [Ruminococcus sp.]
VDNLCGLFSAILRCRPCKAPALLRPSPCLAKNILAKYKSTFYQELVLYGNYALQNKTGFGQNQTLRLSDILIFKTLRLIQPAKRLSSNYLA